MCACEKWFLWTIDCLQIETKEDTLVTRECLYSLWFPNSMFSLFHSYVLSRLYNLSTRRTIRTILLKNRFTTLSSLKLSQREYEYLSLQGGKMKYRQSMSPQLLFRLFRPRWLGIVQLIDLLVEKKQMIIGMLLVLLPSLQNHQIINLKSSMLGAQTKNFLTGPSFALTPTLSTSLKARLLCECVIS